jgi:hypothetical protein
MRPYLEKTHHKKRWQSDPEFEPQYRQKKKKEQGLFKEPPIEGKVRNDTEWTYYKR